MANNYLFFTQNEVKYTQEEKEMVLHFYFNGTCPCFWSDPYLQPIFSCTASTEAFI